MRLAVQYPYSAKMYLAHNYGLPITSKCRSADFPAYDDVQLRHIKAMKDVMEIICAQVGIQPWVPAIGGPKPASAAKM